MADEVHELVVQLKPEGIEETEDSLEDTSEQFDETADSVGDSADEMSSFSSKWRGAMTAVVAGLAVASAGLLAQVPILGELFAGLGAIIEAIAFQMDQVLRPILQPVTDAFFNFAAAIFEAEGPLADLIGWLGVIVASVVLFLGSVAALSATFGVLTGAVGTLSAVLTSIIGIIGSVVAALSLPIVVIGLVIAAILLLGWYFREELAAAFWFVVDAIGELIGWFKTLASDVAKWVGTLAADVVDILTGLKEDALRAGKAFVEAFADGIRDSIDAVKSAASDAAGAARDRLPFSPAKEGPLSDLDQSGPALVNTFAEGIEGETGRVESASNRMASSAAPDQVGAGLGGGRRRRIDLRDEFERALETTDRTDDVVGAVEQLLRATRALGDEFDVDVHVDPETGRRTPL